MTPEEVREVKFRSTPGRGYSPVDVDSLLERVAIQLEAGQSPATTIAGTKLRRTYGGYEPADVDRLLDDLLGLSQNEWNTAQPRHYKRRRSTPVLKGVLLLAFVATVSGGIAGATMSGSARAAWLVVGLLGAAVTLGWMMFTKLSSETAVDESFRGRFFLIGVVTLIGGIAYAVKGHNGGFSITTMFAGLGIATIGGLMVAAELRDTWHRYSDPSRVRRTPGQLLREGRKTILLAALMLIGVAIVFLVAVLIH